MSNYTYILKCKDNSLYTGWTNDIRHRLEAHRSGTGAKYTKGRGPLELVHLEVFDTKSEAMSREARIKALSRKEKMALLQDMSWKEKLVDWGLADLRIMENNSVAKFHLPGLFEFYEFYRAFLPLYREHTEYFYDWAQIASIYGAPEDCIWSGGRTGSGDVSAEEVLSLLAEYGISGRLTFSNSLLREEHLDDPRCNDLCAQFAQATKKHGVILHSDLLLRYIQKNYPELYLVSSTTKVLTDFADLKKEVQRDAFRYVVPDFRLNKAMEQLVTLSVEEKDKVEFLCNECCWIGCTDRKACYENVSRKMLGETDADFPCKSPGGSEGYRFSKAMENPAFISVDDIQKVYLPAGFSNFKIEGRELGSAMILEFLLYYMIKPEYQLHVREHLYLDSMLDLF